jgi:hypothetical protein
MRFESTKTSAFKEVQALLIHRKKEGMEGKDPMALKTIPHYTVHELVDTTVPGLSANTGFGRAKNVSCPNRGPSSAHHHSGM